MGNRLREALAKCKEEKKLLSFPDIGERSFWEGLPAAVRNELIREGEESAAKPIPQLLLSDYTEFSENGNRVHFESRYFEKRIMLSSLVLAECAENKGRFLKSLLDVMYTILEETSWCLPAHNSYIRDTPALPVPDSTRPVVDLFAAETAALLAFSEKLLRKKLAEISPLNTKNLRSEIRNRIIKPYLLEHFWWMGDGKQQLLNWTPWITQNILLVCFTGEPDFLSKEEEEKILKQACSSLDDFLTGYGEDGCCNEGAQYYSHAGLCLYGCLELMNRITEGGMQAVFTEKRIRNMADYIVKMYVGNGYYVNYADCSPFPGKRTARDYLFAKATENKAYQALAASDFQRMSLKERLLLQEYNLYYRFLQLEEWEELEHVSLKAEETGDVYYESTGLMIAKDGKYVLAAKAGNNGDNHNHNDAGSITLYKNGKPLLIDLGVETYTAKTFSDRRYEIWTMQSAWHNTVNFGSGFSKEQDDPEIMQKDGKEYGAENVRVSMDEKEAVISMELSGAYGDKRIRSVRRSVSLIKNREVRITDEIDAKLPAVLTFLTCIEPEAGEPSQSDEVTVRIGEEGMLRASGISKVRIEKRPVTDERLRQAWKENCYRILLTLQGNKSEIIVS